MRTIVIATLLALLAFAYTQTTCVAGATPDFQIDNPPPATEQSTAYTINSDTAIVARVEVTATGANSVTNCDAATPNAPGICISMTQSGNQVTVTNSADCAALLAQFTVTKVAFFYQAASSASPSSSAAPSSAAPSSVAPTTAAPTTAAPSSAAPTTSAPSSAAPSTAAPTTTAPSSAAPSSAAPTTAAPSTAAPSTAAPSTAAPSTAPTTAAPSTSAPSAAPSTSAPTTAAPTSAATTQAPEPTVQGPNPTSASCSNTDISGPNLAEPGKRLAFLFAQATVCSGHGKCNGNVCACDAGWSGSECNVATTTQTPGSTAQISGDNNARAASATTVKLGATGIVIGIVAFFILV